MKKIKPWQSLWRMCCVVLMLLSMTSALHAEHAITISASKTSIVVGESVQLTASSSTVTDLSNFVWQYMEEGSFSFLPLSVTGATITVTPTKTTSYHGYILEPFSSSEDITIKVVIPRDLVVSADKTELALGEEVTLRVESETGLPLGSVRWEKRMGNNDWEEIILPALGESITDIPEAGSTCYRAFYVDDQSGKKVYSEEVCVTSEYKCASNSAYVIFTDDFGKLDSETARNSNQYVGSGYSYVAGCGMLKAEGTYAVMANARYGGCNVDGVKDGCDCTNASNEQMWFRDIYDHTQGGVDTEGKYGGMLLVNADAEKVYSRTITLPCANTNLIFSAWFATASKGATSSVRFFVKDSKGNEIKEATFPIEDIDFADGWIKGETSFYTGDETTFTVEIHNYRGGTDKGNDFLVDDISFSVCSPEVSLSAQSASNQVVIDGQKSLVEGPCKEPLTLNIQTGMAEAIFNTPQYLWFIKEAGDTEFRHLPNNRNSEVLRTEITPYTQYYVVTTANETDAQSYLDKDSDKFLCTPVAISNTYTVLCTPNLSAAVTARECNKVYLSATISDAPNLFDFWWEKSTDGKIWQKINASDRQYRLEYKITEETYFRINSEYKASEPTDKVALKGIGLKSTPEYARDGELVQLTATPTNLQMDGALYEWYRYEEEMDPATKSNWSYINGTTEATLEHSIDRPVDRIKVTADGCEAEVTVKELQFDIEPIDVKCNDIYLQPVANLGVDPISFKWQRSADGSEWNDVDEDSIHIEQDENLGKVARIIIYENSMFRLAEIDAAGTETGLYSLIHPLPIEDEHGNVEYDYYTVKKIGLTATPSSGIAGTEVKLNASQEGLDTPNGVFYNWFKFNEERQDWELLDGTDATRNHTIDAPIAQFKVEIDGCEDTVLLKQVELLIDPMERKCNTIRIQPIATIGGDSINYKWQRSSDAKNWVDVLEENITKLEEPNCPRCVEISFSEESIFRIAAIDENGKETGFYSEAGPDEMLQVKELELTASPKIIQKNKGSVLTITKHVGLEGTTAGPEWFEWKDNAYVSFQPTEREQHKHTIDSLENTTIYKVVWAFCEASDTVTVAQPVKIVVKERECNKVTLVAAAEEEVVLPEYKWQISTRDSENAEWSEWSDYAGHVDTVVVSIDKDTQFQLVGDEISSDTTDVIPYWSIALSIDKESIILGDEVTVTVDSKNINASESILWYKNDQALDYDGEVYTEKPYGPASYKVTQGGCPSDVVHVKEVLWPTVFTPMLVDGFNDDFIIGMEPKVALKIFDRYGNLVVETADGWDGKDAKGNYAMPGVYYYVATLPNGEIIKGNVELLNEKK